MWVICSWKICGGCVCGCVCGSIGFWEWVWIGFWVRSGGGEDSGNVIYVFVVNNSCVCNGIL